jgi:hypothetical protein
MSIWENIPYTVFDGGYYDLVNSNYPVLNNIYDYEQDFYELVL